MPRFRIGLFLSALLLCLAAAPAFAAASAPDTAPDAAPDTARRLQANEVPLVSLQVWKDSAEQERYGFLAGFAAMLELERQWQGQNPLPLRLSLTQSWVRGFEGVTLKRIHDTLDAYIAANPEDLDRLVVEVLWYKFAQPKVTERADEPEKTPPLKKTPPKKRH